MFSSQNNLGGEKSSRSPDKQLPRPDSSPDLARDHRANGNHGNPPSKPPNSSSSLSNGTNVFLLLVVQFGNLNRDVFFERNKTLSSGDIEYLMERRAPPPPVNGNSNTNPPPASRLQTDIQGDLTDECLESMNGTEPKSIVRSNSKSIGGGTRDPSRKGERPEKPIKDQDKVWLPDNIDTSICFLPGWYWPSVPDDQAGV